MTNNNLCNSCTNIGCEFQSGIVREKCAFYMPPNIESDNCGNYVVMQPIVDLELPKHMNTLFKADNEIKPTIRINAIRIPDEATNGDMIKAMFPNAIIEINELGSMVHVKYNNHTCWVNYEFEWWDSPYRKVEE